MKRALTSLAVAASLGLAAFSAQAQQTIKIGMILPMSGPFADYGNQISRGAKLYMQRHGDTVAGKKIELVIKDDTGIAPELTKRLAQELIGNEKVDIIAGFGLSPGALATAPLATQGKRPMVVMNAATSSITTKSPNIVRVSHTLPQLSEPMAKWAAQNGIDKVYILVADFAPGIDAETAFKKAYQAAGKQVIGEVRVPVNNLDFGAFVQRIKDAKPNGVFLFLPPGEATINFMKTWTERGLDKQGIKLLGTGDLTDDSLIEALGKPAIGTITAAHYSAAHNSPLNKEYVSAYAKEFGDKSRSNFMSVAGYDGMALIYQALKKTNGDAEVGKFIAAAKGAKWESPRGMIAIDPDTRDIVQTVYIRRTELQNGKLYNVEFDSFADQKDPGK
ncbi:ABC transporter substrate-binding protein [Noviherbaspirillum cavernae]|uniref:ABC transporter substrate-binding protein n=1 Tax=Noviherbaspirillum cavernae TaxID=2320862 RepID=A0A418X5J1_9BURK|nr:ABC transporter substrate-binding protein [Noviherbaspirillum cavernae]RJG07641.1 ABC transporter substrate-binding protein [Noviherbaspirillum cavernae]